MPIDAGRQYSEQRQREQQGKDAKTNNRIRIGFLIFFIVDAFLFAIGLIGYLIYTPITIDPSKAFGVMSWVTGVMLFMGVISYAAFLDLQKMPKYGIW